MSSKKSFLFLSVLFLIFSAKLSAIKLDGTSSVVYIDGNYVFRNQQDAQGYVALNGGFTLLGGKAILDMVGNVASGMDLRHSSTLELRGDLHLSSNITFSFSRGNYGYINGQDNTIYLGGDLDIADMSTLIITGSMVIDGKGNSLTLGHRSQLLVDGGVSLTLRNLVVKNTLNTFARPALRCMDWFSHLTLDNVELALKDDFAFANGQMFFSNDVVYSGTSTFIYGAVRPSYIAEHSCLHFDPCTTFYYDTSNSATVDSTRTNNDVNTNKDLIVLKDKSSCIFFDNCTLQTTHTGMRLTKGKVFFDNKVTLSSGYTQSIATLTELGTDTFGTNGYSVSWSPDHRYLAAGGNDNSGGSELKLYEWNGTSLTQKASVNFGTQVRSVEWNPNGKHLLVGGSAADGNYLKIYDWDGASLSKIYEVNPANSILEVSWSYDGKYFAVGISINNGLKIYSWNGTTATELDSAYGSGDNAVDVMGLSWHPDGQYLAVASHTTNKPQTPELTVFEWSGTSLTPTTSLDFSRTQGRSVSWSPDGRYLAFGGAGASTSEDRELNVYEWNNQSLYLKYEENFTGGGSVEGLAWSSDGRYLAIAALNASSDLIVYKEWDGSSLSTLYSVDLTGRGYDVAWSSDGQFLAAAADHTNNVLVYQNFYSFSAPYQSFAQSIIFGNSSQGAVYDVDVYILGGARVELDGLLYYDNVN